MTTDTPQKKILFAFANPQGKDFDDIKPDTEYSEIEEAKKIHDRLYLYDLCRLESSDIKNFRRFCTDLQPDILHFSGHGWYDGKKLFFKDSSTHEAHAVKTRVFANFFEYLRQDLKCVFLNSCFSMAQAKLISKEIPYVVAMSSDVSTDMAIDFAREFYTMLFRQDDFKDSFRSALNQTEMIDAAKSEIPVIFCDGKECTDADLAPGIGNIEKILAEKKRARDVLAKKSAERDVLRRELRRVSSNAEGLEFFWNRRTDLCIKVGATVLQEEDRIEQLDLAANLSGIMLHIHDGVLTDDYSDIEHFPFETTGFSNEVYRKSIVLMMQHLSKTMTNMQGWKELKACAEKILRNLN